MGFRHIKDFFEDSNECSMLIEGGKRKLEVSPIRGTSSWAGGIVSCHLVGLRNDKLGGAEGSGPRDESRMDDPVQDGCDSSGDDCDFSV